MLFLRAYLIGLGSYVLVAALSYAAVRLLGLPRGLILVLTIVVGSAIGAWVIVASV
jgi:hypothetical protein